MNIILGITGGIAAYKTPTFASILSRKGHNVKVVVTKSALNFVTEMSLSVMSGSLVYKELDNEINGEVTHIELAKWCDIFSVVPCTANFIGKLSNGIADDLLTTICLALTENKTKYICPAMNTNMWNNSLVQRNIQKLKTFGFSILEPKDGELTCGDFGAGKLPSTKEVIDFILKNNKEDYNE